jgi:zinc transport system ATP-binding protein
MSVVASFRRADIGYRGRPILRDVNFSVQRGEMLLVVGPNGSGKSTLMKTLLGIVPVQKGEVKLFGTPIGRFSDWGKIGYLPQALYDFSPLFPATVEEIVSMGLMACRSPSRSPKDDRKKVDEALDRLDISRIRSEAIGSLSGGQLQRTFLARTIVHHPSLLLLDEPNTSLDPQVREQFHCYIEEINKKDGVTVIFITHDTSEVHGCASRLLYVDQKIRFNGTLKELCVSKEMETIFGSRTQHHLCHQHCNQK